MKSSTIVVSFGIVLLLLLTSCSSPTVQRGDTVLVTYTGKFTNGTIFDTNDKQYLEQFPLGHYDPLTVKAGAGQVIAGFDTAIVGMKKGEHKTVTIKAKDAYGGYDLQKRAVVAKSLALPLEFDLQRSVSISLDQLPSSFRDKSSIGKNISDKNFVYVITGVNDTHVQAYIETANPVVRFPEYTWNNTLVHTTNSTFSFHRDIVAGEVYPVSGGLYNTTLNATHAQFSTIVVLGGKYVTSKGYVAIATREVDQGRSILLDFNHPLAGEDLVFDIAVDDIVPAGKSN